MDQSSVNILEKLRFQSVSLDEIIFLTKHLANELNTHDILLLYQTKKLSRDTVFELVNIGIVNGLKDEPLTFLLENIQEFKEPKEIRLLLEAGLAANNPAILLKVHKTFALNNEIVQRILKSLEFFGDIEGIIEVIDFHLTLAKNNGKQPIDSNRRLFRTLKGETLYELKHLMSLDDMYIDLKIAKALIRNGNKEEARNSIWKYLIQSIPDAIAIFANSYDLNDFLDGRAEISNHHLQLLLNTESRSFTATAWRINAYQEYVRGNRVNAILSAEQAAMYDENAAHFLIYVLKHNPDKWLKWLQIKQQAKVLEEFQSAFASAPKSDLDSKKRYLESASTRELKAKYEKNSIEEIWVCRSAFIKQQIYRKYGSNLSVWEEECCNFHKEGIKRLLDCGTLPEINSDIWTFQPEIPESNYQPFDFEKIKENLKTNRHSLRQWQRESLNAWANHGRIGIIEAATGSGKSEIGILSSVDALLNNKAVVIVVPRKLLQDQWIRNFQRAGLGKLIDTFGGEYSSIFPSGGQARSGRILIALVHSLSAHTEVIPTNNCLLIADEIHLYTGEKFRKIFSDNFDWRIGLTATMPDARDDKNVLRNYFCGDAVYRYTIPQAIRDEVISPYELMFIRVKPTPEEELALLENAKKIQNCYKSLVAFGAVKRDFREFDSEIERLEEQSLFFEITSDYRLANKQIDAILAEFSSNGNAVQLVSPIFKNRGKTLIFSDFKETMNKTINVLTSQTVPAKEIFHEIQGNERDAVIKALVSKEIDVIVSPQAMDVGVDIPELEIGMYVGIQRQRLRLIQRLGRFLRIKDGKKIPLIIIPVAIGHQDDPKLNGNENLELSAFSFVFENSLKPVSVFDIEDHSGISEFIKSRISN